ASYFAPLQLLNPALAPLLQQVDVDVSASNSNRFQLSNQAAIDRTLTYGLTESMAMQLADPAFPPIGPVNSTAVLTSNSVPVPASLNISVPAVAGSSLSQHVSFTGAQAQQFVGDGSFQLEFFDSLTFAVSASPDSPASKENGTAFSKLSGSAAVTYT